MYETDKQTVIPYVICRIGDIPSRRAVGLQLMRIDEHGAHQPWPIVLVRWGRQVFGYLNRCPHNETHLDWESGQFLNSSGTHIQCGKHGALFDLATGECLEGPCAGDSLEPIALAVLDDDICVLGVPLVEDFGDGEEEEPA